MSATHVTPDFIFGTLATDELRLAALRHASKGLVHSNRIEPPDPEPGQPVTLVVTAGTDARPASIFACFTTDGSDPTLTSPHVELEPGEILWDTLTWGYRQEWRGTLPPQPEGTHVQYRIGAYTASGDILWADQDPDTDDAPAFAYLVDRHQSPTWLRDAVMYQIFVDRFAPGAGRGWNAATELNGFWGGSLRGITESLPYLADLGVTCLWLSPIFPSPSHHGYDAMDYFSVEPRFGTVDDLRALCVAAHDRGIRILLDFVANHVSDRHPAFQRAIADPNAPERDWFTFTSWPTSYRTFFGVPTMPRLNTDHPQVRAYLVDAAKYWLRLGVDGFRLDYANGPSHAFWTAFRASTQTVSSDAALIGEVVETAELQRSYLGRLDGTLDFLLLQQFRAFFAFDAITASMFDTFLRRHFGYFPATFVLPSFLDNHDMNRFLWVAQGDKRRLKLAALCQFTLPHPPIVYYGTEVGLSQRRDITYPDGSRRPEESRLPMLWGEEQDRDLWAYYRSLIAARRARPSLWRGKRTTLLCDDEGLLAVEITQGNDVAIVALNRTQARKRLQMPERLMIAVATEAGIKYVDSFLTLPPLSGALLMRSPA